MKVGLLQTESFKGFLFKEVSMKIASRFKTDISIGKRWKLSILTEISMLFLILIFYKINNA